MEHINILASTSVNPPYFKTTGEIIPFVRTWLKDEDERFIEKAVRIFEMAKISQRYSIMPAEKVFTPAGVGDKNEIYVTEMKHLATRALEKAMQLAGLSPKEIDCLITVSCTGYMIPSMDAFLINQFRMNQRIMRLPVTEMGCAGGTSSLIYAAEYLRGNPGKKTAIVSFESPTATLQYNDHSMTNIVSTALFGDGVAAVILANEPHCGICILDTEMHHTYDEIDMMGFKMTNTGLSMILEAEVPDKIDAIFDEILCKFLLKNKIDIEDIDHLLFHPGGKKIVDILEQRFEKTGKKLGVTKEILYHYGNMSSATVFYILERYMKKKVSSGELGLMLSFGPGFTTQLILIKWN